MHKCPKCGNETDGSYSEGGLLWAICETCMIKEQEEAKIGIECYCGNLSTQNKCIAKRFHEKVIKKWRNRK